MKNLIATTDQNIYRLKVSIAINSHLIKALLVICSYIRYNTNTLLILFYLTMNLINKDFSAHINKYNL